LAPVSRSVPGGCDGVVTVTATTESGHRAWYSTVGPGADLSAPGGDLQLGAQRGIASTINLGTTSPGAAGYGVYQGTSMATPAVSAAAALLYSLGLTSPESVKQALKDAVQPYSTVAKGSPVPQVATIDCNSTAAAYCGTGVLDLSRISAPLSPPRVTGRRLPGAVLTARTSGLTGPSASTRVTWWRGGRRVGTGTTYRVGAADLGRTLTVRHEISSGPFAGVGQRASVAIPKAGTRTRIAVPKKVKRSKRARITVTVSAAGLRPTGSIRVFDGSRRLTTKRLAAHHRGRLRFRLPRLTRKGRHTIRVVYAGDAGFRGSSAKKVVRVR